jgi:hypothetical protein
MPVVAVGVVLPPVAAVGVRSHIAVAAVVAVDILPFFIPPFRI